MKYVLVFLSIIYLTACANTPEVKVEYYPAHGSVEFKLTRTIYCGEDDNPIIANHVVATTTHSADLGAKPHQVNISLLDGFLANSDIKFEFYSDGRLKGVNATTTGQGETVIKSVISLATAAGAFAAGAKTECAFIKTAGKGKPLTLTFTKKINSPQKGDVVKIPPELSSQHYYGHLKNVLGESCATFGETSIAKRPAIASVQGNDVSLKLKQPGKIATAVRVKATGICGVDDQPIWEGSLVLAQFGHEYDLPIPKATVFGKQTFAVTLDETGALKLLKYGKDSGSSQTLNVGTRLADELSDDTTAEKAAAVKAEADLIVQQQRLVKCLADPTNCT